MKFKYQFICLCYGSTLLYLISFCSSIYNEKYFKQYDLYSIVKTAKTRNEHFILSKVVTSKTGEIHNTQIEPLEKNDECTNFVSASCDYKSMKTKFKKLPERFAKVNTLNCFITILVTNFYCKYLIVSR